MSAHTSRVELRALAKLAAPMAVASAGQATMGLIDTAVCGRAGSAALLGRFLRLSSREIAPLAGGAAEA